MATTQQQWEQAAPRGDVFNRALARTYTLNWEVIAYAAILLIALVTRFAGLGDRVMSHDESLHTYYSWRLYTEGDFQHTPLMHGPVLFHVTAFFYFLFGDNDYVARLYPAILGVLTVLFPILFRRWLGRWGALLASIMILVSPMLLFHHRYIREDTPSIFFTLIMVWCTFMYIDGPLHLRRKARWLYLFAAAMLLSLGSKESAFMYVAIFGSFMTLYWVVRLIQHFFKMPGRSLFYFLSISALLGGVIALIMIVVLNISLYEFTSLEARLGHVGEQFGVLFSGGQLSVQFTTFLSWTLLVIAFLLGVVLLTAWWASRRTKRFRPADVLIVVLLTTAACLGVLVAEEITQEPTRQEATEGDTESAEAVSVAAYSNAPAFAMWALAVVVLAVLVYARRANWWRTLHRFRELDILILMGSLILPWLTAGILKLGGANPTDYSPQGIQRAVIALLPFLIISVAVGLAWNWKRWVISAAVFYALYVFFFTTMFTNPQGLATGMIGSLGYWLEQQGVKRGNQPQYYYQLIIMPVYEYLPMIGSFLAMLAGLTGFWRFRQRLQQRDESLAAEGETSTNGVGEPVVAATDGAGRRQLSLRHPDRLNRMPFSLFVAWWAVFNFLAYTMAAEKMPWLATHITMPMIFLTAWYFGRVFERVSWATFRERGWLYLLLLPLLFVAVFQAAAPFLTGQSPFTGLQQNQLAQFNWWLAMVFIALVVAFLIVQVVRSTGWLHLRRMIGVAVFVGLTLLTFRTGWMAAFINYDYANEFIVYAHAAPGIKLMMEQIEDISRRTTDGMNIRFAWGGNAWPVTWYFRDLNNATFFGGNPSPQAIGDAVAVYASEDIRSRVEPILEDRYYRFDYIRMWWPMQDYFYLNAQRVNNALDFSPSNTQAGEIRRGMFDIWWSRDYSRYGEATGGNYELQNWPVSERMYLYVRKDVAAQIWNLGVGEGTVMNPLETVQQNQCTANWQQRFADVVLGEGQDVVMNHPLDIAVSGDRVFVAEEFNNRVSVFSTDGELLYTIDGASGGGQPFNRPSGVAVAPNENLYVADTWNYRIVELTQDGEFVRSWGQPGTFGAAAEIVPTDAFWGPRDVAVDAQGNVYVADTGNKRVRVYDGEGNYVRDIGSAGSAVGQLDEPTGLAVSSDGRLFVADTWNRRVSVFSLDGVPQTTFPVRGWYEDLGNRPYLALDEPRSLLYVGDPDAGRVLVYDTAGNCVGSFGQPSDTIQNTSQFDVVGGIAVDDAGNVFVSDASASRVLRFSPFVESAVTLPEPETTQEALPSEATAEVGEISASEGTDEVTPEVETTEQLGG